MLRQGRWKGELDFQHFLSGEPLPFSVDRFRIANDPSLARLIEGGERESRERVDIPVGQGQGQSGSQEQQSAQSGQQAQGSQPGSEGQVVSSRRLSSEMPKTGCRWPSSEVASALDETILEM